MLGLRDRQFKLEREAEDAWHAWTCISKTCRTTCASVHEFVEWEKRIPSQKRKAIYTTKNREIMARLCETLGIARSRAPECFKRCSESPCSCSLTRLQRQYYIVVSLVLK